MEIISVGGKGLFKAYGRLLAACQVPYSIIADRDYLEEALSRRGGLAVALAGR
jgi:hypothetical protein